MNNATFATAANNTASIRETTNGMKTFDTSTSANVDLFFVVGASRGKDITSQFERAYQENRVLALRIAAWARDARGGAGERETFRNLLKFIEQNHSTELAQIIPLVPVLGRWDDLEVLVAPSSRAISFALIKDALLVKQDGLCAKWLPRKGEYAVALRNYMGLTPKGYRKTLVTLTKVVETAMCANDWENIKYSHVPSVAAARYQKAFGKHDPAGYTAYKEGLANGTEKINASAVYPYDVIKSLKLGDQEVAKAQWAALPNYIGDALVLPMVDVSGSMNCAVGGSKNLTCMDVAVSLGLYLADKNSGPFKDCFLTFSTHSKIEVLRGDIVSKLGQLQRADWSMSTDINNAFDEILSVAKKNTVAEKDMPKYIVVFSDMEFNVACENSKSVGAFELAQAKYAASGYELPKIVWWTLNARAGNVPVKFNEQGTALVSGFSPALMVPILAAVEFTPETIMLGTINSERYSSIV